MRSCPSCGGIAANAYDNVLCETVIMHLDRAQIAPSVARMLDIVKPGGIFYLSWRVTEGADQRDKHRRLYAAFDASLVLAELSAATLLLDEEVVSASSGKKIHRVVRERKGLPHPEVAADLRRSSKDEMCAVAIFETCASARSSG